MKITPIKTRIFKENEDLVQFIKDHIKKIEENSVLVVTSKIVALSEGRVVKVKNKKEKEEYIKKESDFSIKTKYCFLTIKDGLLMASAGIDESNADGKIIFLPVDSFKSAHILRKQLQKVYKIKNIGILITDSRTTPLRAGVTGQALGYAGFQGIKSYVNQKDIFGRKFRFSRTNIADCLSSASVFEMGEGNEQKPLAIITDVDLKFQEKINKKELLINIKDDMYLPFLLKAKN